MSHDAIEKLKEKRQLSLIQNITELFLTKFSTHFVFPALGHDDVRPRTELGLTWKRWLPSESMGTFETGERKLRELKSVCQVRTLTHTLHYHLILQVDII